MPAHQHDFGDHKQHSESPPSQKVFVIGRLSGFFVLGLLCNTSNQNYKLSLAPHPSRKGPVNAE